MSRAQIILRSKSDADRLWAMIQCARPYTRVEIKAPKRTIPQNDRMWLMLTIISRMEWKGHRYAPEEWKDYFMHALRGSRWMPGEDGDMVPIGRSTSDLSVEEFGDLMQLIEAFCARQEIKLPWDDEVAA